ncbi:hypothetical protein SLEP1_g5351 [Rubroshorea leprosula]|uniref:Nuclear pore complex protein NUP1 n=1 Tax=Rubroshorea leprosula TaxID=152421 RepID=A0AAV5I188_9ROSI|nr:hypothetical protein SLEP1_g5351 [Rubroshorea leprosula]
MATAREESSRYDGGLGAGGKFKKRPFRRTTQSTPYDRPPIAIRNPATGNGNGWLSKLVDPAQRLIAYSANRLFASVFRKRLPVPPPPPQPPEPETSQETRENYQEAASTDSLARQDGALDRCDNPPNHTGGEFTKLEHILKQKTFTRAEIDRLTTLLHSRTVDNASGTEKKRSEVKLVENGTEKHPVSTPVSLSNVTKALDADVASPAELAKAYMDTRPSKVSTSTPSLRSQVHKDDLSVLNSRLLPSKSPVMSLMRGSSGFVGGLGNGCVTPRSRGRSAIYNMARTPYSRANSTATLKIAGPPTDAFAGPSSSSQNVWEQGRLSVSRQVALKRRLDNDIGSVGPIRRIRQKSNLLSPRSSGLPVSGSPLSIHEGGSGSDAQKSLSLIKIEDTFTKTSTENGINSTPGASFTPVPSKSSQMASKILQQLNELVSTTREKSPTKLSPSMLSGPALKSLENVDSSKFLENSQDKNKLECLHGDTLPDIRDSSSQKQDKVEGIGKTKVVALPDKSVPLVNGIGAFNLFKDNVPSASASDVLVMKSMLHLPQQMKRAFQMSAHEDSLDLDDDDDDYLPNGAASTSIGVERELGVSLIGSKNIAPEAIKVEKSPTLSEIKPLTSSSLNQNPDSGGHDGSMITEKDSSITFAANLPTTSLQPVISPSTSTIDKAFSRESNITSPMFSSGEKTGLSKEQNATIPTFSRGSASVNKVQSITETPSFKFDACSDSKQGNSNSFESVATAANHVAKSAALEKADDKNTLKSEFFFNAPETASSAAVSTSVSAGNIFKFGLAANSSNGSLASSPSPFSSQTQPLVSNNPASQCSSSSSVNAISTFNSAAAVTTPASGITASTSTNSAFPLASAPSSTSATNFKFASPVNPSSLQTASSSGTTEAQNKVPNLASAPVAGTSAFTNSSNSIFGFTSSAVMSAASSTSGGTSSAVPSTGISSFSGLSSTTTKAGSGIFGISPPIPSTGNIFGVTSSATTTTGSIFSSSSASTSMGGSIFGFSASSTAPSLAQSQGASAFNVGDSQPSAAGSAVATSTQSMPIQFGSSPSFGAAGNTALSSGISLFGSSASVVQSFGSGATFGVSSSSSVSNAVSTSGATTSLFGSGWQAAKAPIFSSTFNSTSSPSGFSFGASSTSIAGSTSVPMVFGSSNSASSSSIFPFTVVAAATPSPPAFGSSTPGFAFGSAPTSNNDQMEDSMAEDTVQATTAPLSVFGQQPVTPPSSGFIFGATPPSVSNTFQFGGQQNISAQPNPSQFQTTFQASTSLEFNAGGSFSLGSGGDKSTRKFVRVKGKPRKK